ncbi:MAG: ATP-dependent helicase [Nitrososphaerota archaeon]|nr:ATP-dependent helicase [Nitrososphaerota archaeon]
MAERMRVEELIKQILSTPTKLSSEQAKAVICNRRYVRIIAGAGAGKTETLTRRIVYLLLVKGCQPSEIVAFTFTEKAAQTIKDRVYRRVAETAGPEKTSNLGEMFIGTMHSYAQRLLDDHFGYGIYDVFDENQEAAFMMRHGWSLGLQKFGDNYAEGCLNFLKTANLVWDEMLNPKTFGASAKEFTDALQKYASLLEEAKRLTFGRMMLLAVTKLSSKPSVVGRVKHLIVDEYQDINRAQNKLIELIGKTASVFVVGDPRQSIYQWRGSDERYFDSFTKEFRGAQTFSLRDNRRSAKLLVKAANSVSKNIADGSFKPMEQVRGEKGQLVVYDGDKPEDEAAWIAKQIGTLVEKGNAKYSDMAVLLRSVSTSAPPLLEALKKEGIPVLVGGKVGLFRKPEAQALGRIFSWLWGDGFWVEDPWKWGDRINGRELVSGAIEEWEDATGLTLPNDVTSRLEQLKDDLHSAKSGYQNFTEIYNFVLSTLRINQLDFHDPTHLTVMASLGRFGEILTDYETANRLGGRTPKWDHDLKNLCWFLNSYATTAYDDNSPTSIWDIDAVNVMTVHQAKGLEWPIVFVSSLVDRRFPTSMVGREQKWCDVPRDMFDVARYEGGEEDERRLFYVAVTRARDALALTRFRRMKNSASPSRFLEEMDLSRADVLSGRDSMPAVKIEPMDGHDELAVLSAGDIIEYARCPQLYLLANVLGFQPGLHLGLGFGKSLHYCLRRASQMVKDEGIDAVSAVATAVDDEFHMPFAGGKVLDDFRRRGREILVEFARKHKDDFPNIEQVEYRLEFPVKGATVTGRVDVILKDGGGLEVRDYKTSEDKRDSKELDTQVQIYSLGLNKLGRNVTSGSVAFLEQAKVSPISVASDKLEGVMAKSEKVVEAISDANFEPTPHKEKCNVCDHAPVCRWKVN